MIGALDTKGQEYRFVRDTLEACGLETYVIDTGVLGEPAFPPDVSAGEVAR
ncbi:Tm-1-like ATP-binding domain-containing protein, partial [Paenibacillus sepulcri]|nr:Tm-1-like ATP-binding domain-containing protein [Paenibacillus sepulcri]